MKLVLINEKNEVEQILEENCTVQQVNEMFEDYFRLIRLETQNAFKPKVPITILQGPELSNFMQHQFQMFYDDLKLREELKKKVDKVLANRAMIWKANFKTWAANQLTKLLKKLKKD